MQDRRRIRHARHAQPMPIWMVGSAAFAVVFAGTTYVLTPDAPGKAEVRREWSKRTTDQH